MSKRYIYYSIGAVVLALGLVMNIKAGLGTSAIISVAATISAAFHISLGDATLINYCVFVLVQIIFCIRYKKEKSAYIFALLQLPFSVIFTRFMNLFSGFIPAFAGKGIVLQIIVLAIAIVLTAVGAATMMNMDFIMNPADGFVKGLSEVIKKPIGTTKIIVDVTCVIVSVVMGLITGCGLTGIGIGTLISMFAVGKTMGVYNKYCRTTMRKSAGLE